VHLLTRTLALGVALVVTFAAPWRMRAMHVMPAAATAADHAAHAGAAHHGEHDAPPAHAPGTCDGCEGICCPVVSLTATPPIAAPTGAVAAVEPVVPVLARAALPGSRPRLLPFANGPPA
jgi:hypothetical protein